MYLFSSPFLSIRGQKSQWEKNGQTCTFQKTKWDFIWEEAIFTQLKIQLTQQLQGMLPNEILLVGFGGFFQDWAEDFQISSSASHLVFSPWNMGITVSHTSFPWLITGLFAWHFVNLPCILISLHENESQPRTRLRQFSKYCNPAECPILSMNMKGVLRLFGYLIYM